MHTWAHVSISLHANIFAKGMKPSNFPPLPAMGKADWVL